MALLTPLSFDEARDVLSRYGFELAELRPLAAGSVNSNFLFSTRDSREFFARIYEEQGREGAQFELALNEALLRTGVPAARPIRLLNGELVTEAAGKPFAVYEKVKGQSSCQRSVTVKRVEQVGAALARVHLADLEGLAVPQGRFDRGGLERRLEAVRRSGRADLISDAARVSAELRGLYEHRAQGLPSGLIHGDLFRDNVLLLGEEVSALLDFESACQGVFVYDLAVTTLAWCYGDHFEEELVSALFAGYHAVRPLSREERDALVLEASIACLRFATTRMTDFSLRVAEGEAPLRDYKRFLERLEALRAGAWDAALARLD